MTTQEGERGRGKSEQKASLTGATQSHALRPLCGWPYKTLASTTGLSCSTRSCARGWQRRLARKRLLSGCNVRKETAVFSGWLIPARA